MRLNLVTAPTEEPVSLQEIKDHLRLHSVSFADDIDENVSIEATSHAIASALTGTGIYVLTSQSIMILVSGTNGTGGTLDVKIQESDDNSTYSDWSGSAFTQVTTSNDNAIYEMAYSGNKPYIRAHAAIAGSACGFGVNVLRKSTNTDEDDYLTKLIEAARIYVEDYTNRVLVTQTWDYYLDSWPDTPFDIPLPPLQSVSGIYYTDTDLDVTTVGTTTYRVDTYNEPGRVNLAYGQSWANATLDTVNGFKVRFVAGYGTASAVPENYKTAIKMIAAHWYEHREANSEISLKEFPLGVDEILNMGRVVYFA